VTGTGVHGSGTTTCAESAINRLKATTSAARFTQSTGASTAPLKVSALAYVFTGDLKSC
jgi:hypothetical protein